MNAVVVKVDPDGASELERILDETKVHAVIGLGGGEVNLWKTVHEHAVGVVEIIRSSVRECCVAHSVVLATVERAACVVVALCNTDAVVRAVAKAWRGGSVEEVKAVCIGGGRCDHVAVGIEKFDDHSVKSRLAWVSNAVCVGVEPHAVSDLDVGNAALCLDIANTGCLLKGAGLKVRTSVIEAVAGDVFTSGCSADGFVRKPLKTTRLPGTLLVDWVECVVDHVWATWNLDRGAERGLCVRGVVVVAGVEEVGAARWVGVSTRAVANRTDNVARAKWLFDLVDRTVTAFVEGVRTVLVSPEVDEANDEIVAIDFDVGKKWLSVRNAARWPAGEVSCEWRGGHPWVPIRLSSEEVRIRWVGHAVLCATVCGWQRNVAEKAEAAIEFVDVSRKLRWVTKRWSVHFVDRCVRCVHRALTRAGHADEQGGSVKAEAEWSDVGVRTWCASRSLGNWRRAWSASCAICIYGDRNKKLATEVDGVDRAAVG